jgi:hypothetical protein
MLVHRPRAAIRGLNLGEIRTPVSMPSRLGSLTAAGARAAGAAAVGAIAIGALALGALAIGRLAIGRARIRRLEIDELVVRRLRVTDRLDTPQKRAPESDAAL